MTGGEAGAQAVLRRKAAGGRQAPPEADESQPLRALQRALARAAQADCGLALAAPDGSLVEASLAELLDQIEPHALLAVLEGPGELLGLVALGPEVLAGLIEQQTGGAVLAAPATPRRPTRTDAAMAAGLVDRLMAELELGLAAQPDLTWAGGYRYASFLDDPRPLGLLLDDIPYRRFLLQVALAGGARQGGVLLALPAEGRRKRPAGASGRAAGPATGGQAAAEAQRWATRLETAVLSSPAAVEAVLARLRLPLAEILRWQEGDLLPLGGAGLDEVVLRGPGGMTLARGRLGQTRGHRALRLALPEAQERAPAAPPDPAPAAALVPTAAPAGGLPALGAHPSASAA